MRKMLYVLPFILSGCETMSDWAAGVDEYVPEMPTVTSAPAKERSSEPMQKTNTNMYSVPPQ